MITSRRARPAGSSHYASGKASESRRVQQLDRGRFPYGRGHDDVHVDDRVTSSPDVDRLAAKPAVLTGGLFGYARGSRRRDSTRTSARRAARRRLLGGSSPRSSPAATADRPELGACLDFLAPATPSWSRASTGSRDPCRTSSPPWLTCAAKESGSLAAREPRHHHPGGRLVFHVFAALAEFIRELIVCRHPRRPRRRPRPRPFVSAGHPL